MSRGIKWLKASVGSSDHTVTARAICRKRLSFMQSLKIWKTFGKGWSNRVADIEVIGEGDPDAYMRQLIEAGASMAVLTAAEGGATAYTRRGSAHVPSRCGRLVDTVGAGDSFMAALLFRLQSDQALSRERLSAYEPAGLVDLLTFAQAAAAYTCARTGAVMPTREDIGVMV